QELNGLEVFAATVLIGNPLARLARIIEIEHRGDGVHAQAVNVEALAPEQGIGEQKIDDFVAAIIEDQRTPVLVLAFARVLMLEESGPVETGQRPIIARKV